MTTQSGSRPALGRPLPADARNALCLGAGAATFLLVLTTGWLALVNLYGPFGESTTPGTVLALLAAVVGGVAALVLVDGLARRSGAGALAVLAIGIVAGAVLLPRQVDRHESWVPRPNQRYACTGWSFEHYPPGVMDGDGTTYCVGLERRLPDG